MSKEDTAATEKDEWREEATTSTTTTMAQQSESRDQEEPSEQPPPLPPRSGKSEAPRIPGVQPGAYASTDGSTRRLRSARPLRSTSDGSSGASSSSHSSNTTEMEDVEDRPIRGGLMHRKLEIARRSTSTRATTTQQQQQPQPQPQPASSEAIETAVVTVAAAAVAAKNERHRRSASEPEMVTSRRLSDTESSSSQGSSPSRPQSDSDYCGCRKDGWNPAHDPRDPAADEEAGMPPLVYTHETNSSATHRSTANAAAAGAVLSAALVDEEVEMERLRQAEALGREQVLAQVVEADVEPIPSCDLKDMGNHNFRKYRRYGCLALLIVLAIAAIGVALTMGKRNDDNNSSSSNNFNNNGNSTAGDPTDDWATSSPSMAPTMAISLDCELATDLPLNGQIVFGSFEGLDTGAVGCDKSPDDFEARWFSIVGPPGNAPTAVTVSLCSMEGTQVERTTLIAAVSTGDCTARTCVPTESVRQELNCIRTTWWAVPDQVYQLAVGDAALDGVGQTEVFSVSGTIEQRPSNLRCEGRREVFTGPGSISESFFESLQVVNNVTESYIGCDGNPRNRPTKWYIFEGKGLGVTFSVCGQGNFSNQGNFSVEVFDTPCGSTTPSCEPVIAKQKDGCTTFSWDAKKRNNWVALSAGSMEIPNFQITLSHNEMCETALPIGALPVVKKINTRAILPGFETKAFNCPILPSLESYRGAWFEWTANSTGCLSVEARLSSDDFIDPIVTVYSGSCAPTLPFDCVTMSDNLSVLNPSSAASFDAIPGTTYYILVSGKDGGFGEFELVVDKSSQRCSAPPDVTSCQLCSSGEEPTPLFQGADVSCSALANEAFTSGTGNPFLCSMYKTLGKAACSCPEDLEIDVETCSMCPDGSDVPNPNKIIPSLNMTCGNLNELTRLDNQTSCGEGMGGIARFCGCPSVPSVGCSLCGSDTDTNFNPDLVIEINHTCRDAQTQVDVGVLKSPPNAECSDSSFDQYLQRDSLIGNRVGYCCRGEQLSMEDAT